MQSKSFNVLGECDCKSEYLRYLDSEENLSCHLEFTQGPCENDQVLMQPEMNETDEIMENSICIPKICMEIEMCFYNDYRVDLGKITKCEQCGNYGNSLSHIFGKNLVKVHNCFTKEITKFFFSVSKIFFFPHCAVGRHGAPMVIV